MDTRHSLLITRQGTSVERVFLYHMRRAGGTSLRSYCQSPARENGLQYNVVEGCSLDYDRYFAASPATLHVVCLRDPIDRIKSSYRFEGRWRQRETVCTAETAKSFSSWEGETRCDDGQSDVLWKCSENYYVKALIGYPRVVGSGVGRAELDLAKRRLREFGLVLITESLSHSETAAYVRQVLNFDMPIPHERYPELERPEASDEELFDAPTLVRLQEANQLDFELYQEAKELLQQRMGP